MKNFTRKDGEAIRKKLGGTMTPGKKGKCHDNVEIWHGDVFVARYGLRRGKPSLGHDYIPKQLHISPRRARELADCTLSAATYFAVLAANGRI